MALKKAKELPSGIVGEYWKIIEAKADKKSSQLIVRIALFKDKQASDGGMQNLGIIHLFSGVKTSQELLGNLFELGYNMIKEQCSGTAPSAITGKLKAYNDLKNSIDA